MKEMSNNNKLKTFGEVFLAATWSLLQNLCGLIFFLLLKIAGRQSKIYKNRVVTYWKLRSGLTLGNFIFINSLAGQKTLDHAYGHTLQSAMLGPLWLIVVGLPSIIWCGAFEGYRIKTNTSYYAFYTEKWADKLGKVERGEK